MTDFEMLKIKSFAEIEEELRIDRLERAKEHPQYDAYMEGIDRAIDKLEELIEIENANKTIYTSKDRLECANDVSTLVSEIGLQLNDFERMRAIRAKGAVKSKNEALERATSRYL